MADNKLDIKAFLDKDEQKDLLRLLTAGSVDDGKSTLIGRLLFDSKKLYEDQLDALERDSKRVGNAGEHIDYALLLDGLKAERERREAILIAEGEKKSTVLVAEGEKESVILKAEAEKQAAILQAEAEKEKRIKEAEGEAEAILKVQQANADGIRFIREAGADQAVLTIKSLEAFEKAADGKATKIIIPSELQSLAGLVKSAKEVIKED